MAGPLAANPNPISFDAGPLGPVYVTGAVSALGLWQNNTFPGDQHSLASLSNGQFFFQKTEGFFQYFVQAGAYTLPSLGTPYINTPKATGDFYGPLPQAFVKVAPTDEFSISAGKLPTLIGAEYTFSFENMNIERGLLWNQENAVNRGVQANYTAGPLAFAQSPGAELSAQLAGGTHTIVVRVDPKKLPESLRLESSAGTFIGGGGGKSSTNSSEMADPDEAR